MFRKIKYIIFFECMCAYKAYSWINNCCKFNMFIKLRVITRKLFYA